MEGSRHNFAAVHAAVEAFHGQDLAAMAGLMDPAFELDRGDGGGALNREECLARIRNLWERFPDASLVDARWLEMPEGAVLVEWVMHAGGRGGSRIVLMGADLLRFGADGRAVGDLAKRYTEAWCCGEPARVAAFFAENDSLRVNSGAPAVGRASIAETARSFMTAFPDLRVSMDGLLAEGENAVYRWTLTGTNSGPGGSGKRVRISGYEVWRIGANGLIEESRGHFDSGAYLRQLGQA